MGRSVVNLRIAITLLHYTYVFRDKQGAPLDYVRNAQVAGDGNYVVFLATKAPHPNAGKAFIDFFDYECMNLMSKLGGIFFRRNWAKGIGLPSVGRRG